jgi:hypothetical protein
LAFFFSFGVFLGAFLSFLMSRDFDISCASAMITMIAPRVLNTHFFQKMQYFSPGRRIVLPVIASAALRSAHDTVLPGTGAKIP